ncbi:MAG: hypothetical protein LKM35_04395 [Lachnospiraceae bacterium]|jgi:hypothetical protein|nr:hypothetical protein [Lachnospiraceae bacterium]MCI1726910.1 hypothetical protein [Lachnospiraceae bacterium]
MEGNIQKFDDDDFLAGMFLGSMLGHHGGGGGRGSSGCCGPGCAVMMLTLPFVMIFGFILERKEKKASLIRNSQEDTEKSRAEHTEK